MYPFCIGFTHFFLRVRTSLSCSQYFVGVTLSCDRLAHIRRVAAAVVAVAAAAVAVALGFPTQLPPNGCIIHVIRIIVIIIIIIIIVDVVVVVASLVI